MTTEDSYELANYNDLYVVDWSSNLNHLYRSSGILLRVTEGEGDLSLQICVHACMHSSSPHPYY